MRKYVLPVLMWMIILKVGVVAVYLAGNWPGALVRDREVPEAVTAPVSVPAEPGLPSAPVSQASPAAQVAEVGKMAQETQPASPVAPVEPVEPVQEVRTPALSLMASANAADTVQAADTVD
jgi:hypothetical protein